MFVLNVVEDRKRLMLEDMITLAYAKSLYYVHHCCLTNDRKHDYISVTGMGGLRINIFISHKSRTYHVNKMRSKGGNSRSRTQFL